MCVFSWHSFIRIVLQFEEIESDDNLKEFMKKPIELAANAVKKRRQSDFASTTSTEFAVRKKTMPIHSSVLAISNRTPSAIVEPRTNGGHKGICSTPARTAVDETNNVPKIGAGELKKAAQDKKNQCFYHNFVLLFK